MLLRPQRCCLSRWEVSLFRVPLSCCHSRRWRTAASGQKMAQSFVVRFPALPNLFHDLRARKGATDGRRRRVQVAGHVARRVLGKLRIGAILGRARRVRLVLLRRMLLLRRVAKQQWLLLRRAEHFKYKICWLDAKASCSKSIPLFLLFVHISHCFTRLD